MKQRLIATAVIVVLWLILDYIFHGVILMGDYSATAQLWRPMEDMKAIPMNLATIATALVFVILFCQMIKDKTREKGIKLGVYVGLIVGIGMSLGTYSYMPITIKIAAIWFISTLVKYVVAGVVVGSIVTKELEA